VLARRAAPDQIGVGEQTVAHGGLLDDVGVVAGAAEPLIDDVDEADVVGAIETRVHEVGPVGVEDHVTSGAGEGMSGSHVPNDDKGVLHGS
jgi:hypothetical protein